MNQRFRKQEHLKSRKLIQQLFKEGKAVKGFPILAVYATFDSIENVQVGFSVSKKKMKLAVDRNRIKRQMSEAFRLNKGSLELGNKTGIAVMFIYMPATFCAYAQMENGMKKILRALSEIEGSAADNQP